MPPWLDPMPPLPPGAWLRRPPEQPPFPLAEPGFRLFRLGRHALWQGVRALGIEAGDRVLVPAYHHGSEVEALVRSGVECVFYAGSETLEPAEEELESLFGEGVRALQLIHYLGFPQDAPRWRRWCDEHGLLLLEDAAQSWLAWGPGHPIGSQGDLAIFSPYKTVGVPHGGALACSGPAAEPAADGARGLAELVERHLAWARQRLPLGGGRPLAPDEYDPEADFALGDPEAAASAATRHLLPRLAAPDVAARRRAAYRALLEVLGERLPSPFDEPGEGACPFVFPIDTDDKRTLLERLARAGVGALDLWSVPHPSLPVERFPAAASRRARTVGLPVHQELRPADLERIVAAVEPRGPVRRAPRLEPVAALEELQEEWPALAERGGNVFLTWEWASAWWRHFGVGGELAAAACRKSDGTLAAILPLYRSSFRGLPALRFIGQGAADQLGPVCAPADRELAAAALRRGLRDGVWHAQLLLGENLPGDEGWGALLGGMALEREPSPVLRFDGMGWDDFLATRSRNFRQQVRRRERKLTESHELRYRMSDRETLERDLETLFELHDVRWGEEGAEAFRGPARGFHHDWAAAALERGWLRLWTLELDGRPAAAWYGFRFGAAEWYYQSGRDPALEADAVGFVLLCHTIREAMADGMREYRMLLGGEAYKDRFANRDPGLETIAVPSGALGRALLAAVGARRAARSVRKAVATARATRA